MAWTLSTVSARKYLQMQSPLRTMNGAAALNSDDFDIDLPRSGYAYVGVKIVSAGSDVAATLKLQGSPDGSAYVNLATLSSDLDPHVTGFKMFAVDLSLYPVPYLRLTFNEAGAVNPGSTGTFYFYVQQKPTGTATDPYVC